MRQVLLHTSGEAQIASVIPSHRETFGASALTHFLQLSPDVDTVAALWGSVVNLVSAYR